MISKITVCKNKNSDFSVVISDLNGAPKIPCGFIKVDKSFHGDITESDIARLADRGWGIYDYRSGGITE